MADEKMGLAGTVQGIRAEDKRVEGGGRNQNLLDKNDTPVICRRCKLQMIPEKTFFDYIGHNFHTDLLRCPKCNEVYIPEKLVKGRMAEVERELEDK